MALGRTNNDLPHNEPGGFPAHKVLTPPAPPKAADPEAPETEPAASGDKKE